ncbi:unnamed protein product [Prorocentrum cordatum]|uniref:Uncharacterized protein n=1 Tax=Prorocentrum cordatum TaxID=2364126 RepID=A0ABN9SLH7_9DINO|nr:unnamed protein product [Polarella glacialis]
MAGVPVGAEPVESESDGTDQQSESSADLVEVGSVYRGGASDGRGQDFGLESVTNVIVEAVEVDECGMPKHSLREAAEGRADASGRRLRSLRLAEGPTCALGRGDCALRCSPAQAIGRTSERVTAQVGEEVPDEFPPAFVKYLSDVVIPQSPIVSTCIEFYCVVRAVYEAAHAVLSGKTAYALDVLSQRLLALQLLWLDKKWSGARWLELFSPPNEQLALKAEECEIVRAVLSELFAQPRRSWGFDQERGPPRGDHFPAGQPGGDQAQRSRPRPGAPTHANLVGDTPLPLGGGAALGSAAQGRQRTAQLVREDDQEKSTAKATPWRTARAARPRGQGDARGACGIRLGEPM